jgi:hypothetical protein
MLWFGSSYSGFYGVAFSAFRLCYEKNGTNGTYGTNEIEFGYWVPLLLFGEVPGACLHLYCTGFA